MARRNSREVSTTLLERALDTLKDDRKNDRALALVVASFLEAVLGSMLKARMLPTENVEDMFRERGPLGSFSTKIDFALALGVIFEREARQLHLIRKVRNHFAHRLSGGSFTESPARQLCAELDLFRDPRIVASKSSQPRERRAFFATGLMLGTMLEVSTGGVRRIRPQRRPPVFRDRKGQLAHRSDVPSGTG